MNSIRLPAPVVLVVGLASSAPAAAADFGGFSSRLRTNSRSASWERPGYTRSTSCSSMPRTSRTWFP
jgi:hypothetical protein